MLRTVVLFLIPGMVSSCSAVGAPSFDLFGAFFPAWLFRGILGLQPQRAALLSLLAFSDRLPDELFVCTAIGVVASCLAFLIGFGRWP